MHNCTNIKSIADCVELAVKHEYYLDWWGCVCVCARVSGLCRILNTIPVRATGEMQERYETFVTFNFLLQSPRHDTLSPPPHGASARSGSGPPHCRGFTITLRHTTLVRTPLEEWSARRRDLHLTTLKTQNRHPRPWWDSNPQSV